MVTNFLLVRHGQSTWNAQRRWQGQADPPLSDLGREQAQLASAELRRIASEIAAVVSSPQQRAAQTAQILVENTPAAVHLMGDIEYVDDLMERSAGPWSGLTKEQIDEQYPGHLAKGLRPDGYELDDQLFERVERALSAAAIRHAGKSVLVVCHGGVINTVADRLTGAAGRMPNLSGHRLTHGSAKTPAFELGERIDLLPQQNQTGGDASRV